MLASSPPPHSLTADLLADAELNPLHVSADGMPSTPEQGRHGPAEIPEGIREFLRTVADPTRLRILQELRCGEACVTTLCKRLNLAQPTISHHLGLLRAMALVTSRRSGKNICYALDSRHVRIESPDGVWIEYPGASIRLALPH